jgi:hypothetical protein
MMKSKNDTTVSGTEEVRAAAIEIDEIIPLPPLNPAAVKSAYESNSNTNAFTDAAASKLGSIEQQATQDQTPAEIVAAVDAHLGNTNWQTQGTGGGGGGSAYNVYSETIDGLAVVVHYHGATEPNVDGDSANGYRLTMPAGSHIDHIDLTGDSNTAQADGTLLFIVDNSANGYDRKFTHQIYDGSQKQEADKVARGHSLGQAVAGNVTTLETPNIGGSYPNGFDQLLR